VEILDRFENLGVAQVRIVQRSNLRAFLRQEIDLFVIKPAILFGLLVKERTGVWRGQGNLNRVRIDLLREVERLLDRFLGFPRKHENKSSVDDDSELVAVF